jgi:putative transcriptional regulator
MNEVNRMSELFDLLSESLNEAITDAKSEKKTLRRHTRMIKIEPLPDYTADEIKVIRDKVGFTQKLLAAFLGVSPKTIEAWESGKNKPNGPSLRLLSLIKNHQIA